jgi:hypothetical protein
MVEPWRCGQMAPRRPSHSLTAGGIMRPLKWLLATMLFLTGAVQRHAMVHIANDRGGPIGYYIHKYEKLRASHQSVIIDGLCASACTIALATVAPDNICVTPRARMAFHAAWDFGAHGREVTNRGATRMLYSMYPSSIKRWLDRRGGLTPRAIFLQGRPLEAMYHPCRHRGDS